MSPAVEPAVVVERLGRPLRIVEVAAEDVAAAREHLTVVGENDLAARDRRPDRADVDAERRPGHRSRRLREAVDLRHLARRAPGRRAAPPGDRRRPADRGRAPGRGRADRGRSRALAWPARTPRRDPAGSASPRARSSGLAGTDRQRGVEHRLLIGIGACQREHAGVELLPDPRDAEHDLRPGPRRGTTPSCDGSGQRRHLEDADDALVVRRHPLGDVRHRQVRDERGRSTGRARPSSARRLSTVHTTLAWSSITPFGAARRARRVDDRGEVVGLHDRGRGCRGRRARCRSRWLPVHDVAGARPSSSITTRCSSVGISSRTFRTRSR